MFSRRFVPARYAIDRKIERERERESLLRRAVTGVAEIVAVVPSRNWLEDRTKG